MWKYHEKVFLEHSDIGFPRFTTLRRKIRDAQLFGDTIYERICKELGIISPPDIVYLSFLNCPEANPKAFGCCTHWEDEHDKYGVAKFLVGLSKVHTEDAWEKIYYQTLPHEIAHAIHRLFDVDTYNSDGHGKLFLEIYQMMAGIFPIYKDTVTYKLPNAIEYYDKINEAVFYDLHADKLQEKS